MNKESIKNIFLSAAIIIMSACGDISPDNKDFTKVEINLDTKENIVKLSDIADTVTFIPLETKEESRLGSIDKLILENGNYIIVDKQLASAVFVFDQRGKFLQKIGRKGKAKNEYIELTDAAVDNDNVYIYDARGKKVICYSMDGSYIETYPFEYTATEFKNVKGSTFAFYCTYSHNADLAEGDKMPNLIICDLKSGEMKKDMMFASSCSYDAIPVVPNNMNPFLYSSLSDEVFDVGEDGKAPVAKIDYGKQYQERLSEFIKKVSSGLAGMNEFQEAQAKGSFPMLINFMDAGNAYFTFCVKGATLYYDFLFKKSGTNVCATAEGEIPVKDDFYGCMTIMPKAAGDGKIYVDIDPSATAGENLPVDVRPDENPVLAVIKLKE